MARCGVVLVPEDRDAQGLVGGFSSAENVGMAVWERASRWGFLRRRIERLITREQLEALAAPAHAVDADVVSLSGGTRQKVLVGKWLATRPRVLMLDEPTHGVDVGTKAEIHAILRQLARERHIAVLVVSSDLEEVVALADRVLVMRRGRLVATFAKQEATEQAILRAASGTETEKEHVAKVAAPAADSETMPPSPAAVPAKAAAEVEAGKRMRPPAAIGRLFGPLLSLAVLAAVFAVAGRHFASASNVQSILFTGAVLAIAVIGQAMVVLTRNLDLSIGAVMAAGGYLSVLLYIHLPAAGPLLLPIAAMIGALFGCGNGFAVAYARIPSLVATLGTMSVFRGLLYASAGGQDLNTDQLPPWLLGFVSSTILGVPTLAVVAIVVLLAGGTVLQRTRFGRTVYAVGSNPAAAVFYGLPSRRTILQTYALGGAIAGVAGLLLAGVVGTVTVDLASGWELETLAAVVIGGVSLLGGSGSLSGAVLGALILTTIDNGLIQAGASGDWQNFVRGFVIIAAVALDLLWRRQGAGRMRRRRGRTQLAEAG